MTEEQLKEAIFEGFVAGSLACATQIAQNALFGNNSRLDHHAAFDAMWIASKDDDRSAICIARRAMKAPQ